MADLKDSFPISDCKPNTWGVAQIQQRGHEDRYQAKQIGPFHYYTVFDGHGGSKCMAPEHVADYAVEHLHERLAFKLAQIDITSEIELSQCIRKTFADFDTELWNNDLSYGTCCTMVLIDEKSIYQVNLGDSRSLIFNETSLISVTKDHNPNDPEERERVIKANGDIYKGRIHGMIAVSRAFGDFEFKTNDNYSYHPENGKMSSVPDIKVVPIMEPMFVCLTSDAPFESNHFNNDSLFTMVNQQLKSNPSLLFGAKEVADCVAKRSTDDTTILLVRV